MIWALVALLAALLFSTTNFIDKYILHRHLGSLSNVGYLSLAGIAGLPILAIIASASNSNLIDGNFENKLLPFLAGLFFSAAFAIYIKCLSSSDTSMTASLFQITIFWNIVFGWIVFDEHLSFVSITAMFVLLIATFFLSHEIDEDGKRKVRHEIYMWMFLACLFLSISDVLFKLSVEHGQSYLVSQFFDYLATVTVSFLILVFSKKTRSELDKLLKKGARVLVFIVLLNETINIIGTGLSRLSIINLPIASAQAIMGIQPLILIAMGIILTKIWPHRIKERLGKKHLFEKLLASIVIIVAEVLIVKTL